MSKELRPAIMMLMLFTLIPGIAYPLAMTGIPSSSFPIRPMAA